MQLWTASANGLCDQPARAVAPIRVRALLVVAGLVAILLACAVNARAAAFKIHVVSSRADLISGGEALTSVTAARPRSSRKRWLSA